MSRGSKRRTSSRISVPRYACWMRSSVPAMTPMWMPSLVVPPWMSPMSLSRAVRKRSHDRSGSIAARTPACATWLSVEPCEVRGS